LIDKRAAKIAIRSLSDLTVLRRTIVEKNLPLKDNFEKRLLRKIVISIGSKNVLTEELCALKGKYKR